MAIGKYTVNEVEERTKVPASTLRQWERRYGFPEPERNASGYRLYSDEDVAQIEAMRKHIASGVAPSRAAALLKAQARRGEGPRPLADLRDDLLAALLELNESRANAVMSEAHALHPVNAVMLELMQATMLEIGTKWHAGEVSTTTEHYASAYVNGRLRALLNLAGDNPSGAAVIVACAPLEQHELGPLILAVMLRRNGFRVVYLGANTPVADLAEMARALKPKAVFISASTAVSVAELLEDRALLAAVDSHLVFGGRAFNENPALAESLGGRFLGRDAQEALKNLHVELANEA